MRPCLVGLGITQGFQLDWQAIRISNERLERFFTLFNDAYLTESARSIPPRIRRDFAGETIPIAVRSWFLAA